MQFMRGIVVFGTIYANNLRYSMHAMYNVNDTMYDIQCITYITRRIVLGFH